MASTIRRLAAHSLFELAGADGPDTHNPASSSARSAAENGACVPVHGNHRSEERLLTALVGLLGAVGLSALWGLAANAHGLTNALSNAIKVPMLLFVSSIAALPPILVFQRLTNHRDTRSRDLFVAYGVAMFGGALVLAVLAPIVALYQHSSSWAGPWVALGSAIVAFGVAMGVFARALTRLTAPRATRASIFAITLTLAIVQLAVLAQLASVVSPVFERRTAFGHGIDAVSNPKAAHVAP